MALRALALGGFALVSSLTLASSSASAQESRVTLREGTNFAAALAPDGSYILDLQGTLWRLPADGGVAQALTDALGDDRAPDVSPDGTRVVFQSYRSGTWDIWSMAPDGTGAVAITEGEADDREPVISPDGAKVAFSSDREGQYDLFVLELGTGTLSRATFDSANDYMPSWTPDSSSLVFVSDREPYGLYRVSVAGAGNGGGAGDGDAPATASLVAAFDEQVASPSVGPDGRNVAVRVLTPGVSSGLTLVPMNIDGGERRVLATPPDVFPFRAEWADAATLVFTANGRLYRMKLEADGSEAVPVSFEASVSLDRPRYRRREVTFPDERERHDVLGILRPGLSPDGALITYAALGDIWIVPAEGGDPLPMTRDEYLDSDPQWSPDGKRIVFTSDRAGTMDIWIKDVEAPPQTGEVQLTSSLGAEIAPAWSPDGTKIAYVDELARLHVVGADGRNDRALTESRRGVSTPSWSSDSVHVALAVHVPVSTRFREGPNRILIVDTRSGEERLLGEPSRSFGTRDSDGPVWSPDGSALAFAMDGGLWILPVSASGEPSGRPRQVTGEPIDFPSWSPDGERLLYVTARGISAVTVETGDVEDLELRHFYDEVPSAGRFVVRDVRVIDGTGGPPRDHLDVFVEGSRIDRVEPSGTSIADEDVRVVDGSGKTLIPGLIDMHAHLSLPSWGSRHGKVWLAFGVTAMRTPADATFRVLEERESIRAGRRIGPRVFMTGGTIDGDRIYYTGAHAVGDPEELEQELSRAEALDYDLIKTYVRLPDDLQKEVVRAAHARGTFVTSHEVYPAVAYGVDGIEHIRGTSRRGYSPKVSDLGHTYQDVVELIARSGVYLTPTLLLHGRTFPGGMNLALVRDPGLLDDPRLKLFPPFAYDSLRERTLPAEPETTETMRPYYETIAAIASRGGNILAGTDAAIVPYGLSLILEVELLSEAGLGPLEAIRSATSRAAEALGAARELGTVEAGKLADLVLLSGDPTEDIRNLRQTEMVVIGGRLLALDQLVH